MLDRPPTLKAQPLSAEESEALFAPSLGRFGHALLAVSGGADSTALLALAAEWAGSRGGPRLSVATVDHGLRPESTEEARGVAALADRLSLPHARLSAPIASLASGVEAAAREARYAALFAHAKAIGAQAVGTAHTLDDQAETVLLRLAAGSGPTGLAAMRAATSRGGVALLRPLLGVEKPRLVATLQARSLAWFEDAMNAEDRYARVRLRAGRAVLEREGLTAERLATLARRMARVDDAVEASVDAAARDRVTVEAAAWRIDATDVLAEEIRLRLVGRAVAAVGGGRVRLDRLERLVERIRSSPAGAATLAGARIVWAGDVVRVNAAPPRRSGGAGASAAL